jgi:drug/metabolite transporter (DMT)-like permease
MDSRSALVLLSAVLYGVTPLLIRAAYDQGMSPFGLQAVRTIIGGGGFWLAIRLLRLPVRVPRASAGALVLLATTLLPLQIYGYIIGLKYLPVSAAAVLIALVPVHVVWMARLFLGERIQWFDAVVLLLVVAGAVLVAGETPKVGRGIGLVMVATATLAAAGYTTTARRLVRSVEPVSMMAVSLAASAPVFFLSAVLAGEWRSAPTPAAVAAAAGASVLATVLAPLVLLHALQVVSAPRAAMLATIEPVVTVALSVALLGDRLTMAQTIGAACVIGGVGLLGWVRGSRATLPRGRGAAADVK